MDNADNTKEPDRVSPSTCTVVRAATGWLPSFSPASWMPSLRWVPTSDEALAAAERTILAYLKTPYEGKFITVVPDDSVTRPDPSKASHRIWTVSMNTEQPISETPIVLVHGFGGGVGMWAQNLDALASRRPLYAFDVLGFGQSSRPAFSTIAETAESQFIDSMEAWRKEMKLSKFILLGHSLGAFLAASYSLKYPEHVRHLIMVDPWGLPERPLDKDQQKLPIPFWIRTAAAVLQPFNPLAGLRAAGPWGPRLVGRFRPDLQRKFSTMIAEENAIFDYIYHCNAQAPSGESAFKAMTGGFGWAKSPMSGRMTTMASHVPVSFIYGSRSWIDHNVAYTVKDSRNDAFTEIILVSGAGHHVYADKPAEFNDLVGKICRRVDDEDAKKSKI
ncbi:Protein ABHD4 [Hypsibius exemplaris]|uniref:1-acylglycerol-3-phosphate O-acyltransferase ABHD5 n=1 Tax=Hypsibius exemplaris TaxID=2072580 RepID=A0A1W0WBY9_HYPEX|nr:Protein ABHD4 [Hypsibius exemplaris]